MEKVKDFAAGVVGIGFGLAMMIGGWLFFAWLVSQFVSNDNKQSASTSLEASQEAMDNTERRAYESAFESEFINACVSEWSSRSDCQCGFDTLNDMYSDFMYNEARLERILRDGYSQEEVDATMPCFGYGVYNDA